MASQQGTDNPVVLEHPWHIFKTPSGPFDGWWHHCFLMWERWCYVWWCNGAFVIEMQIKKKPRDLYLVLKNRECLWDRGKSSTVFHLPCSKIVKRCFFYPCMDQIQVWLFCRRNLKHVWIHSQVKLKGNESCQLSGWFKIDLTTSPSMNSHKPCWWPPPPPAGSVFLEECCVCVCWVNDEGYLESYTWGDQNASGGIIKIKKNGCMEPGASSL